MANSLKIIYRILKILEKSMEYEEFDFNCISYERLNISQALWTRLMSMLVENGLITGVVVVNDLAGKQVLLNDPEITLKGLEYLGENSAMKKASDLAKGIWKGF